MRSSRNNPFKIYWVRVWTLTCSTSSSCSSSVRMSAILTSIIQLSLYHGILVTSSIHILRLIGNKPVEEGIHARCGDGEGAGRSTLKHDGVGEAGVLSGPKADRP